MKQKEETVSAQAVKSVIVSAGVLAGASVGATYEPRVGVTHEDFTLPSIRDGKPVTLSAFRGKKVLLINFSSW